MKGRRTALIGAASLALLAGCFGGGGEEAGDPTGGEYAAEREAAEQLLTDEGYLDDDGDVAFGPAGPPREETAVHEALCTYVFGAPGEVAERAGLGGSALAEGSGYQMLGANGSGVRCGWGAEDEPVFAMAIWGSASDWITDEPEAFDAIVDLPDGTVGLAGYDPDSDVERLPVAELEAWLQEAPGVSQSV